METEMSRYMLGSLENQDEATIRATLMAQMDLCGDAERSRKRIELMNQTNASAYLTAIDTLERQIAEAHMTAAVADHARRLGFVGRLFAWAIAGAMVRRP